MTCKTAHNATACLMLGSAVFGAAFYAGIKKVFTKKPDPEKDHSIAHAIVWNCIGGALKSSMLYIWDRLELYARLHELCQKDDSSINAIELANVTGLNQRWLREWLAQQASMGILKLLPGEGDDDESLYYRLPKATGEVLADSSSDQYDIAMISAVPSLVNRAKTMLPEAFRTGIGRAYDEPEVAEGIDRHHKVHIRKVVIPLVIPQAGNGRVLKQFQDGCSVADLGCGGGNLCIAMAREFPKSNFHGYEVSAQALSLSAYNVASSKLRNVFLHDANQDSLGDHVNEYDVVTTFDVLHDAPNPAELIAQVRNALKPDGIWVLGDIACLDGVRENVTKNSSAADEYCLSACLCMSCSLSSKDGAGLGTLGFTIPVASKMLKEGGFTDVQVLLEEDDTRWFVVS